MNTYDFKRLEWQELAHRKVNLAIRAGKLTRPIMCQLCGAIPPKIDCSPRRVFNPKTKKCHLSKPSIRAGIFAHHHAGYGENWLKIWWVCSTCNKNLLGDEYHNGSLTLEQAREHLFSKSCSLSTQKKIGKLPRGCRALYRYIDGLIAQQALATFQAESREQQ